MPLSVRLRLRPAALLFETVILVGVGLGCAGDPRLARNDDPLMGAAGRTARPAAPPAGVAVTPNREAPARESGLTLPALPATLAPSAAALAMNPKAEPSAENRLAIEGARPAAKREQASQPADVPGDAMTWEQAQAALRARGVTWYQLEMKDGQWHFRCSVPHASNPQLTRFHEAHGPDDLAAVRAVLQRLTAQR